MDNKTVIDSDLKLLIAMARTYNEFFNKINADFMRFGITSSEFGVLELLYHKGPQPIQQIAVKILVTSGTMTYVIDKLIKKQLLERRQCQEDKRIYYAQLTPEGQDYISKIFPLHHAYVNQLLEDYPEREKQALLQSLRGFYNYLKTS